eukprot:gene10306-8237_t
MGSGGQRRKDAPEEPQDGPQEGRNGKWLSVQLAGYASKAIDAF